MTAPETFAGKPPRDARFWDRIADRYAAKPVADEEVYRRKLEITRGYLRAETALVEFGCGTGSTAIAHAPHVRHVLATDISPRMIDIATEKARNAGVENVGFRAVSLEDLEVPPRSVDVVLGLSILHLVKDVDAAITKVHEMLRPGGVFVSSTVCLADGMRWFALVAPIGRAVGLFPRVKVLGAQQVRDALAQRGFVVEHDWQPGDGRTLFLVARKPA